MEYRSHQIQIANIHSCKSGWNEVWFETKFVFQRQWTIDIAWKFHCSRGVLSIKSQMYEQDSDIDSMYEAQKPPLLWIDKSPEVFFFFWFPLIRSEVVYDGRTWYSTGGLDECVNVN